MEDFSLIQILLFAIVLLLLGITSYLRSINDKLANMQKAMGAENVWNPVVSGGPGSFDDLEAESNQ